MIRPKLARPKRQTERKVGSLLTSPYIFETKESSAFQPMAFEKIEKKGKYLLNRNRVIRSVLQQGHNRTFNNRRLVTYTMQKKRDHNEEGKSVGASLQASRPCILPGQPHRYQKHSTQGRSHQQDITRGNQKRHEIDRQPAQCARARHADVT